METMPRSHKTFIKLSSMSKALYLNSFLQKWLGDEETTEEAEAKLRELAKTVNSNTDFCYCLIKFGEFINEYKHVHPKS